MRKLVKWRYDRCDYCEEFLEIWSYFDPEKGFVESRQGPKYKSHLRKGVWRPICKDEAACLKRQMKQTSKVMK